MLHGTRNNSVFWLNPVKWSFRKPEDNSSREYEFQLKGKDLNGTVINEGLEIPLESLVEIALTNAQNAAPDAKLVMKEYRVVNGKKVIYMEINGTISGFKFTYLGYYYSTSSGSTQFIAYTAQNAVDKYKSEIIDFLNGLDSQ